MSLRNLSTLNLRAPAHVCTCALAQILGICVSIWHLRTCESTCAIAHLGTNDLRMYLCTCEYLRTYALAYLRTCVIAHLRKSLIAHLHTCALAQVIAH